MASVGHPPPHNPAGPPHAPPPAYFVDTKKGEVSELKAVRVSIREVAPRLVDEPCRRRPWGSGSQAGQTIDLAIGIAADQQLLKNISVEKDAKRKRDVIKKVIAYMTLGIDVSRYDSRLLWQKTPAARVEEPDLRLPACRAGCSRRWSWRSKRATWS